jgi:hypothetical protein
MIEENDEYAAPVAQVCLRTGAAIAAVLDHCEGGSIVSVEEIKEVSVLREATEGKKEVSVQLRLSGRDDCAVTV